MEDILKTNKQKCLYKVINRFYTLKDNEYKLKFTEEESYIKGISLSNDIITYQYFKNEFSFHSLVGKYDIESGTKEKITDMDYYGELVYIDDEKNGYFVRGGTLTKVNLDTKKEEALFSVDVTKESINNAQILKKYKN